MEVNGILLIIFSIVFVIIMVVIFIGCNAEKTMEDYCNQHSKVIPPMSSISPYDKCMIKQVNRENLCADYFWWLRY